MHDIKYFFLNKINYTIQKRKFFFPEKNKLTKTLLKNIVFQNSDPAVPL
jgi:hypothetical protein